MGSSSRPASPETVTAPDGRRLAYCEFGDADGAPVFSLHGTPGSRLTRHPTEEVYRRAGVRVITYDRPGYGASTRHAGRRVADAAGDVRVIAEALGLDTFAVIGQSGGGPHALACAALLADRVTRCTSIVGPAPLGPGGLSRARWFEGMVDGHVREFAWAIDGEDTLRPELERQAPELVASLEGDASSPLGEDFSLSDADLGVMLEGPVRAMLAVSLREAVGRSIDGYVDDDLAFARPWGFDVAAIGIPVCVAYGPHDTLVPAGHGAWLARTVPDAEVVLLDGGHFATYERLPDLLAWLTDAAP